MKVTQKWRPSLALIIAAVVATLVLLPFVGLIGARITSNQFVRQTEANLHAQAAVYAEVYAQAFSEISPDPHGGVQISLEQRERLNQTWHPVDPVLSSNSQAIGPPRPDPRPTEIAPAPPYVAIGDQLSALALKARKTTLAGFLALDVNGQIIAASGSDLGTLAHVPEVKAALAGKITSAARWREEEYRNHSLRSVSRDTKFRVYVAHPVVVSDHVIGVVYLSRTPSNINKYLIQQRHALLWLVASIMLAAGLIGLFLWRVLTRPMRQLQKQAREIADGQLSQPAPHYGSQELADLGQSIFEMGTTLSHKTEAVETYTKHATHELKSPVTSIMAAAELLENPSVSDDRRKLLAGTIKNDAGRMDRLLLRMREMVRKQTLKDTNPVTLSIVSTDLLSAFPRLSVTFDGDTKATLPLPTEALEICLRHTLENAQEHGATEVTITFDQTSQVITIEDNGMGISQANSAKAIEPFFTTKRETGGTGMGLNICAEVIAQFDGELSVTGTENGAIVSMSFQAVP